MGEKEKFLVISAVWFVNFYWLDVLGFNGATVPLTQLSSCAHYVIHQFC